MAGSDSFIQVNASTVAGGKKLATYEYVDTGGNTVESEAVTLTDSIGNEILGQQTAAGSLPVVLASDQPAISVTSEFSAALTNGADTAVGGVAVKILAANMNRAWCLIQNTGGANVRVGSAGITASSGIRLTPNAILSNEQLNTFPGDLWAIAEGSPSTVATLEASL